jgi:MFS family permease
LPTDRRILYAGAFVRAVATAQMGVLLGLYLARRALDLSTIGLVVGAGLTGAAVAALVATVAGDHIGRRRLLTVLAALAAAGALATAASSRPAVLVAAAFVGMLNGMGRDRGAALILEQAALPATAREAERTLVFARYNVLQDAGHALGSLLAGLPGLVRDASGTAPMSALQGSLALHAGLMLAAVPLYRRLSAAVEAPLADRRTTLSPASRRLLARISALFFLDSLGGGFLATALLSLFFARRFGVGAAALGGLFFAARLANAASHLLAAWLARRIGLVNTMVFTHIPSSLLLLTVPFAPSFPVAALLFLLREGLVEMDVPTRQSYVMAVVAPPERTIASGVTHLVRLAAWALGPAVAGRVMDEGALYGPLVVGAVMKIAYDVLLYLAFRRIAPPEERPGQLR